MAKKRFACCPEERTKDCEHGLGFPWNGRMPCTGEQKCPLCGLTRQEAEAETHNELWRFETVNPRQRSSWQPEYLIFRQSGGAAIADVGPHDGAIHDARLIAAAPALRDALRWAMDIIDGSLGRLVHAGQADYDKASAALRNALKEK